MMIAAYRAVGKPDAIVGQCDVIYIPQVVGPEHNSRDSLFAWF
jgi:hypothetical protein